MKDIGSLLHSKWECKYHVYSFPNIDARRFTVNIEEGHLMVDHVHVLISIPPKYSVSQIVGFIKGKSAIGIARTYFGRRQNFTGQNFWVRGYYVSPVGRDEVVVRQYIRDQEKEDQRLEQLKLW
ncbi:IS200/IS605 family transposase [Cyanobacteria bacterium FACHB-471]|nr:IS200/IS605 family transposase [Cyanobacteria bacterium FACHB-471]